MADDKKSTPGKPQEEPILARLKSGGQTPTGVTSFVGLLGRSPKPGHWLLYLSLDMGRSVEIDEADIIQTEQLSPDQSPFGGLGGTRVFVKQDAKVTTTQTASHTQHASAAADEFDLDIRLGAAGPGAPALPIETKTCPDGSACRTCDGTCEGTCLKQNTCVKTCNTHCGQHTCVNTQCAQQTCVNTQCGQHTCVNTQCAQHTCVNTQCGQHTCGNTLCGQHTCATCLGQDTCRACTHINTCAGPHCFPQ
jgi:hypothetical protein